MPEIAVTSLDPRHQKLIDNARIALERGQLDYTLDACTQVLKTAPGCLPVRRLQRAAQLRDFKSKNKFMAKAIGGFSTAPFMFGGGKKEPAKVLETAEGMLAKDPTSVPALKLLAEAAGGLGLLETVAFALDAVREIEPDNRANLLALGEAWITAGKPAEALKAADAILKTKPADADAQNLMRKASIAQTVTKGNWDGQGNFRDKLRDEAQAVSLEQAAKVVTAGDMAQRLVDEAKARVQAEPTNLNHYRAVAQAYRQLGRSDEALVWVRKARALPNGAVDPTLEKEESELQTALLEARVKAESGDGLAAAQAELAAWRLTEAKRTVERYPNDFPARLGAGRIAAGERTTGRGARAISAGAERAAGAGRGAGGARAGIPREEDLRSRGHAVQVGEDRPHRDGRHEKRSHLRARQLL
jgi:tetratricopeptide (TPR) repeat protein